MSAPLPEAVIAGQVADSIGRALFSVVRAEEMDRKMPAVTRPDLIRWMQRNGWVHRAVGSLGGMWQHIDTHTDVGVPFVLDAEYEPHILARLIRFTHLGEDLDALRRVITATQFGAAKPRAEAQAEPRYGGMGADRRVQVGDTDYEVAIYEGRLTIFGCDCCESVPTVDNAEAIRDLIEEWIHYTPKAH
ncbi:hypothetical protein NY08_521 [Rhodococcus sp. B7740]|uniref:hypothetical protein n=1 Tax=Rhodococcus sp. B7740 TaxID=1564114 RepID=UPI0005D7AAD0|nr:hypothetical protein [Rhodococcus sp. B7740]AJW38553.1 hypothetical protein NY08_521 [Rhodococcus sp. B7740]